MSTRRLFTVVVLLGALVTSACGGGSDPNPPASPSTTAAPSVTPPPATHPIKGISSYVALGDSYTSGPAIAKQERDAGLCFRSDHNYASLLAHDLAVRSFKDVSCAGATTTNVLQPVRGTADGLAQVAAVKASTSLVTVGIGGNDSGLFGTLFQTCSQAANTSRDICRPYISSRLPQILAQTQRAIAGTLEAVKARAPRARVVLVGYLRLTPSTKGCANFPVTTSDLATVAGAESQLDAAMSRAAKAAGVEYVSMRALSAGHDACAGAKAWTNGASVANDDGFPLHPNSAGMRAVASTLERVLRNAH